MPKISVVVITYNEEKWIEKCLDSVQEIADEIVVLDSYSTDNTTHLARAKGAVIYQQKFQGYGIQKNDVNALAVNDWILSLDADEILTPEIIKEIQQFKLQQNPLIDAYKIPRLNNYLGKWLKYGGWYPDAKIRLFNKLKGAWKTMSVHEYWQPHTYTIQIGQFESCMLHYTISSFGQHLEKIEKYTELSAQKSVSEGKRVSLLQALIAPKWFFFNKYILRLGFLDGYEGYLMCKMASMEKWLKYQKIRKYAKGNNF
jgi:glycosyltransferase involved in cell wall biosynthesis